MRLVTRPIATTMIGLVLNLAMAAGVEVAFGAAPPLGMDGIQGFQTTLEHRVSEKKNQGGSQLTKVVKGEVLRIQNDTWFIKENDGRETQFAVDQTTRHSVDMAAGDRIKGVMIEALLTNDNHALSVSSTDRRTDH